MIDSKTIDDLAQKLTASLPPGVREFHDEVEKSIRASLQAGFSRLDLVTREEFDAQAKVLARTRAQLEELNRRVAELEQGASGGATASGPGAQAGHHGDGHGSGGGPTGTV